MHHFYLRKSLQYRILKIIVLYRNKNKNMPSKTMMKNMNNSLRIHLRLKIAKRSKCKHQNK